MATRIKQTVRTTTTQKVRVPRNGTSNKGYRQCNICHGTGIVKTGK